MRMGARQRALLGVKWQNDTPASTAYRSETVEVFLYAQAMRQAQRAMEDGAALSPWLARMAHGMLLAFGRGADLSPGQFKT